MALPVLTSGSINKSIFGTNASDAVSYNIPRITTPLPKLTTAIFLNIAEKAVAERTRRGGSSVTIPNGYYTGKIFATKIQEIKTNVEIEGPAAVQIYNDYAGLSGPNPPATTTFPKAAAPSGSGNFSRGQRISSGIINALIDEINTAGAVCLCNCNYCTCNCNYCTCNCNYSCTCNCNY